MNLFRRNRRPVAEAAGPNPYPLSESMLELQGVFRGQRDEYGLPLIEERCSWCGRGAGVDAVNGSIPVGWWHYGAPSEVLPPPPPQVPPTYEEWQDATAKGSTNMSWEMYQHSNMFVTFATTSSSSSALCPDCGRAATGCEWLRAEGRNKR